jgi:hypothetical protein
MADQQVPEDGLAMQEEEVQDQPDANQAPQNEPQVSIPAHSGSSVFSSSEVSDASLPDLNLEPPPEHSLNLPDVLLPANPMIAQPQPVDFLGPEVQLEDLMNEEEINAQALEGLDPEPNLAAPLPANSFNLNLNVGLVRVIYNPPVFGPSNPITLKAQPIKLCADLYRLWAKNFSPVGNPDFVVQVPKDWAPFFLNMLSSPNHFDWAKTFLASFSWKVLTKHCTSEESLPFALPKSCPDGDHIVCEIQESASKQPEPEHEIRENRSQDSSPLSESAYRRSLRIKSRNGGFRSNSCTSKNCLACSSTPPAIPRNSLQNIGVSACNIPPEKLTEKALKSKPKSFEVIGDKLNTTVASGKGQKLKKKVKDKGGDDDSDADKN